MTHHLRFRLRIWQIYDFVRDLCTTRRPPLPGVAHPPPRGAGHPGRGGGWLTGGISMSHRSPRTTRRGIIELCTRRSLRPGTRFARRDAPIFTRSKYQSRTIFAVFYDFCPCKMTQGVFVLRLPNVSLRACTTSELRPDAWDQSTRWSKVKVPYPDAS